MVDPAPDLRHLRRRAVFLDTTHLGRITPPAAPGRWGQDTAIRLLEVIPDLGDGLADRSGRT